MKNNKNNETLINESIRCKEVMLIDENQEQQGIVNTKEALKRAQDLGLDLVLMGNNKGINVAKIMDYGKFRYQQQKKQKENKQNQKQNVVKEIRISPTIDVGDYNTKLNQARKFLEKKNKVQFTLRFKGRMISHSELGMDIMNKIIKDLEEETIIDQKPKLDGRKLFLTLAPKK